MRCKKHPADFSSTVGVCASCLRERLFAIMAAQAQAQLQQAQLQLAAQDRSDFQKSDTTHIHPPSLAFPRSVSPYISRRKSDTTATWQLHGHQERRFYSTPQVGPNGSLNVEVKKSRKNSGGRFYSLFLGLFRSKSEKPDLDAGRIPDPGASGPIPGLNSRDPCTSSPSWFSSILPTRRKKQVRTFSLDVAAIGDQRRTCRNPGRGMSPARFSDDEDDEEHCRGGSSGYSSESSQGWKQTPKRTPVSTRNGGSKAMHNKNMSGLTFCLSPLVRASPNRHRNQKGIPPDLVTAAAGGGEARVPPKPYLSAASSFCKNRSRKLADFGRYNPNY